MSPEWFKSYLTDIKQYVHYSENDSYIDNISFGVPQGSVLGPLLFIIYTNDLPTCLALSKCILFADDTTIYLSSSNINDLYDSLNHDLDIVSDWFKANKLSLNITKIITYMVFNNKQKYILDGGVGCVA